MTEEQQLERLIQLRDAAELQSASGSEAWPSFYAFAAAAHDALGPKGCVAQKLKELGSANEMLTNRIQDLEQKLATSHLKFTMLDLEFENSKFKKSKIDALLVEDIFELLMNDPPYDGRAALLEAEEFEQRKKSSSIAMGIDMATAPPPTPESLELDQLMMADPELQEIFEENSKELESYVPDESSVLEENSVLVELGLSSSKV